MHRAGQWTNVSGTAYLERADPVAAVDAVLGKGAGEAIDAGLVLSVRDLVVCDGDGAREPGGKQGANL